MDKLYLYGANGHGKVIAEIAESLNIEVVGFIDLNPWIKYQLNYPVIHKFPKGVLSLLISIGDNQIRKEIALKHSTHKFLTLIHPKATISTRAVIEEGTVVMAGVTINSEVKIGKQCIINTNASVDHDCVIEDYVHISPNVALAGNVKISKGTHVGTGACVIPGVKIGKWCTIGAGSVIIRDVPDGVTVVGNPGRIINSRR